MKNHIIICGLGHVGFRLLDLFLRLGEKVSVITLKIDHELISDIHGVKIIEGDARDDSLLKQAGVDKAKGVLAVTDNDLVNVSIALDVKRMNPEIPIVLRLFDRELASHLEKTMGIHKALSTSAIAAPAFVAAASGGRIVGSFETGGISWLIEEMVLNEKNDDNDVGEGKTINDNKSASLILEGNGYSRSIPDVSTGLSGRAMLIRQIQKPKRISSKKNLIQRMGLLYTAFREWWRDAPRMLRTALVILFGIIIFTVVLFHKQLGMPIVDSFYFVVTIITTVGFGDYNLMNAPYYMKIYGAFLMVCGAAIMAMLFSVITDLLISTRLRDVMGRACSKYKGHVIVAGLGNVGYRVLQELARHGETIVAVEREEGSKFIAPSREIASVVLGNAATEETMHSAGLAGARAVIAATDDDTVNLSVGLAAKRAGSCRMVMRIFDDNLAEKMRSSLGADGVLSVSASAAPVFAVSVLYMDAVHGFIYGNELIIVFKCKGSECNHGNEKEILLFLRKPGEKDFSPFREDYIIEQEDEIIGIRRRGLKRL